ncbi:MULTISPECIES: OmpA family protein [unclassified Empedobacter]|uniref:OmpA family protein n=1 Tax=unclassified Empedobacter TaxID=2643773 RepID=UPI00244816ED|nr:MULTISPECIES: OmpA family protein [unclassified Empedobacter]MDH1602187.1 OmpA family protein [Empedobacter sp. GD03739]
MKKISYLLSVIGLGIFAQAQEVTETVNNDYNKWSIEANGGANKATKGFSNGYFMQTPSFYHVDLGVRYMFNPKFGLKLDGAYDRLKEGEDSKRFRTNYYRVDLQGVANLGRIMNFEDWTKSIGLLAHAGAGYSWMTREDDGLFDNADNMGNIIVGLTPQLKLSDRIALTGDVTYIRNIRQQNNYDFTSKMDTRGLDGDMWNATLGLTFYLGGNQKHADWTFETTRKDLEDRIANIEQMLKDTDGDGVADYLDQEPDSAPGAVVDTKGVTIDHNGNGIPDNIEEYIKQNAGGNTTIVNDADFLEQMINSGIINVYFDYNSDKPYQQSVGGIKFVSEYLKAKPNAQIDILGYADPVGSDSYNKDLSRRRAENVKAILVSQGANASQLTTVGEGEDKEFKNSQVSSHQLARRVVFRVK